MKYLPMMAGLLMIAGGVSLFVPGHAWQGLNLVAQAAILVVLLKLLEQEPPRRW